MAECRGLAPPRLPDSESGPSAIRVEPHARKLVHPAGLPPANSPFEAEDDNNFTTDAEMVGGLGFAHLAVRQHFSPVKSRDFTVKVCNPDATRRRS
jgi:hypothetical protein